jgi:hypothetical protein
MICIVDNYELEKKVEEYLNNNDFKNPLFIVGYPGIGKTSIVRNVFQRKGIKDVKETSGMSIDFSPSNQAYVFSWNIKAMQDMHLNLAGFDTDGLPTIVEITVDCEGEARQFYRQSPNYEWLLYRLTVDKWIKWAKESHAIEPFIINMIENAPNKWDDKQQRDDELKKIIGTSISACMDAIEGKRVDDIIDNFKRAFSTLKILTLSDDEIKEYVMPVIEGCTKIVKSLSDSEQESISKLVWTVHSFLSYNI